MTQSKITETQGSPHQRPTGWHPGLTHIISPCPKQRVKADLEEVAASEDPPSMTTINNQKISILPAQSSTCCNDSTWEGKERNQEFEVSLG